MWLSPREHPLSSLTLPQPLEGIPSRITANFVQLHEGEVYEEESEVLDQLQAEGETPQAQPVIVTGAFTPDSEVSTSCTIAYRSCLTKLCTEAG